MFSCVFRTDGKVALYWRRDLIAVVRDKETVAVMLEMLLKEVSDARKPEND